MVSGAWSWIRMDHGGSITVRNRNAPRARGLSRKLVSGSMLPILDHLSRRLLMHLSRQTMFRLDSGGLNGSMTEDDLTLITGGTGRTGRRVANRLRGPDGRLRRRIGSRSGRPPFDWHDPSTWDAALAGVKRAYLCYNPDLAFPGVADMIGAFSARAVRAGVEYLVILSGRGEDGALASEQAVRESGADWTVVRSAWFAQNFSEHFLLDGVRRGEIAMPAGLFTEPFVNLEDVAEIAAAALTQPGHAGKVYELTGPRLMTFADAVEEIARAVGRPVRYRAVTAAEFADGAVAGGVPRPEAEALAALFGEILDGRGSSLTADIQQVLGRPAGDFADYARRAASSGVWNEKLVAAQ